MHWYDDGPSGWGFVMMTVGMVLLGGLLLLGVAVLVRSSPTPRDATTAPRPGADEILAERLARGEIDETEYAHRLAVLHGGAPTGSPRVRIQKPPVPPGTGPG